MSLDMIPTHYPFENMVEAQETTSKDTVNIEVIANDAFQARQAGQVEFLDDTDIMFDWVFPFKGMGFPTKSTQLQFQSQVTFYICNIILFLQADTKQYRVV